MTYFGPASGSLVVDDVPEDEDPEARREENRKRSARRRMAKVRRYCVANDITKLWTLTYGVAQWDATEVMNDVNGFMRRLRDHLGEVVPYVYVLELHPGGHGIHVHIGLQDRWISHAQVRRLWGHGHVHYSKSRSGPKGARMLARYLSKYMVKDLGLVGAGRHAYEVAQGFAPVVRQIRVTTFREALDYVCALHGKTPERVWSSDDTEGWRGPPTYALVFD